MTDRDRFLLLIALACLLAAPASAQRNGLEFGFPAGVGLDSVDPERVEGYDLSWTRRDGGNRGLRLGLTLAFEDLTGEQGFEEDGPVSSESRTDLVNGYEHYALRLQKLFLTEAHRDIRGVFGVGPMASYSDTEQTHALDDGSRFSRMEYRAWEMGLAWDLGVEWTPVSQVSVGARYGWSFVYRNELREQVFTYVEQEHTRRYSTEMDGLSLGSRSSGDLLVTVWF